MEKNKSLIIVGVVILILLLAGGFFVMNSQKKNNTAPTPTTENFRVEKLSSKDIGLELVPKTLPSDGKQIKVIVNKLSDIKRLDYDITYEADIPKTELAVGEEGGRVERGVHGEADITSSDKKYESEFLDLGSASKNVVRYDAGVIDATILMKVTKKDGKLYQVEDKVSFE